MPSPLDSSPHTSSTSTPSVSPTLPTSPPKHSTSPTSPSCPKPSNATPNTHALRAHYASQTTTTLTHLSTLLSRTSTLDTTLLTATYTLTLLHTLLTHRLSPLAYAQSPTSSKSPRSPPYHLRLLTSLPPLTTLLSSLRIHLRLWALLPIYLSALKTYHHPPSSTPTRILVWSQILASAVYQGCENAAFLAEKGVLAWRRERIWRVWRWSARVWGAWVVLELGRLGLQGWKLSLGEGKRGKEELRRREMWVEGKEGVMELNGKQMALVEVIKEEGAEMEVLRREVEGEEERAEERWREWCREVGINAAYAPMTVHYSLENGLLGEGSLGALGMVVAWLSFGKAWRECA